MISRSKSPELSKSPEAAASSTSPPRNFATTVNKEALDKFERAVRQAKSLGHVRLEGEEEQSASSQDQQAYSSDEERVPSPEPTNRRSSASKAKSPAHTPAFSCLRSPDQSSQTQVCGANAHTIDILQQMTTYYASMQDTWRTLAYRRAIATLRTTPSYISTPSAAAALPGIVPRLASKIAEIATAGRLRRLDASHRDAHDRTLGLFLSLHGVGFAQASLWTQQGHRSPAAVFGSLVLQLTASGFLTAALAAPRRDGSVWQGTCVLPGPGRPWRRLDLLVVPWEERGAVGGARRRDAVLYGQ